MINSLNITSDDLSTYPFGTLMSLLHIFLRGNPDQVMEKRCITLYYVLDICAMLKDYKDMETKPPQFVQRFMISDEDYNLVHGLYLLDSGKFPEAAQKLTDSSVNLDWLANHIFRTFYIFNETELGLKFYSANQVSLVTADDIMIYLDMLLKNGLSYRAFNSQRDFGRLLTLRIWDCLNRSYFIFTNLI